MKIERVDRLILKEIQLIVIANPGGGERGAHCTIVSTLLQVRNDS